LEFILKEWDEKKEISGLLKKYRFGDKLYKKRTNETELLKHREWIKMLLKWK
jgi:hypothetical protein